MIPLNFRGSGQPGQPEQVWATLESSAQRHDDVIHHTCLQRPLHGSYIPLSYPTSWLVMFITICLQYIVVCHASLSLVGQITPQLAPMTYYGFVSFYDLCYGVLDQTPSCHGKVEHTTAHCTAERYCGQLWTKWSGQLRATLGNPT